MNIDTILELDHFARLTLSTGVDHIRMRVANLTPDAIHELIQGYDEATRFYTSAERFERMTLDQVRERRIDSAAKLAKVRELRDSYDTNAQQQSNPALSRSAVVAALTAILEAE